MFAAIRHPDVAALGVTSEDMLDHYRAKGWVRVSEWAPAPSDLSLAAYAEVHDDLDAPAEDNAEQPADVDSEASDDAAIVEEESS